MDLRMFAACLIMTVFLIKHSAAVTGWTGKQSDGTTDIIFSSSSAAAGTSADDTNTAFTVKESTTGTLFTLTATGGTGALTYTFTTDGNPSSIASDTITAGAVTLATGKALDYETKTSYVFKVVATDSAGTPVSGTAEITINIGDVTMWTSTGYTVCLTATSVTAGTSIGTFASTDALSTQTVAYTNTGGTDTAKFAIDGTSGALTVATSQTLETSTKYVYDVILTATVASVDPGTTTVYVVLDCSCSSGAGQITALLGVLLLSVLASLY
ncbi:cadherin-12-like [Mya arenaria]|uniref:cadherin-12-like n=1 Tax=Mya arenaria TaxID=6604 RepID=UPI0022DF2565|nr:cadherin-12-like [Mya arenaria]